MHLYRMRITWSNLASDTAPCERQTRRQTDRAKTDGKKKKRFDSIQLETVDDALGLHDDEGEKDAVEDHHRQTQRVGHFPAAPCDDDDDGDEHEDEEDE